MGQNSSRGNQQSSIQINHPKFSSSKILHKLERQVLRIRVPCDQKSYKVWKQRLQKYKDLRHEYFLTPLDHEYHSNGMCTSRGSLEIDFDYYPYLLTDEIHHRQVKGVPFTEPELWYLLYAYLSVKNFLTINEPEYPYNLIGDVRPHNVFINSSGLVKFSNLLSWPSENTNYSKTFQGVTTYLAPEDYQLLQIGSTKNPQNTKSEDFSIGFTLLSAAILKDNTDLYNLEKQQFNLFQAKKRINAFKCLTLYSELLRTLISSLCSLQIHRRIQLNDLWVWITKYESRIMAKQPFMIDQIPPNINEHINLLRQQILSLEPSSSVLNLNSVKSLKGSQAKFKLEQGNSDLEIKTLKVIGKQSIFEKQNQKRRSRIVINTGSEEKIFENPTEGAYFTSQVTSIFQISQNDVQIQKERPKVANFYSPPSKLQNYGPKYEPRRLVKSPQGYYTSKESNNFRVFIQYKSPSRVNENNQAVLNGTSSKREASNEQIVQKKQEMKIQTDSNSQKSGGSNRQNRFIQSLIKAETNLQNPKNSSQQLDQLQKMEAKTKNSPIHKIETSEEVMNHGVSEVVSQEIIIGPANPVKKTIQMEQKTQTIQKTQIIQTIQIIQRTQTIQRAQQSNDYQIAFDVKENLQSINSLVVNTQNISKQQIQQLNSKPGGIYESVTSQILENFRGLSPVKKQSTKKVSLHDSKRFEQQLSHDQDMKRIQHSLEQSDILRHIVEEQINQMTRVNGDNVVLPSKSSTESLSIKFQIHQNEDTIKNQQDTNQHLNTLIPPYHEMIAQIFPVAKESVKKKKTLSELQIQKHNYNQQQIQRKLNQMEQIQSPINKVQEIVNLQTGNQEGTDRPSANQIVSDQIGQNLISLEKSVDNRLQEQRGEVDPVNIELQSSQQNIKSIQREVLQIATQIIDLKQNFQIELTNSPQLSLPQHYQQQQSVSAEVIIEEIIDKEKSSQKEPSLIKNVETVNQNDGLILQHVGITHVVSNDNILILDEVQNEPELNQNQSLLTPNMNSQTLQHTILKQQTFIPLGPQNTVSETASIQQIQTQIYQQSLPQTHNHTDNNEPQTQQINLPQTKQVQKGQTLESAFNPIDPAVLNQQIEGVSLQIQNQTQSLKEKLAEVRDFVAIEVKNQSQLKQGEQKLNDMKPVQYSQLLLEQRIVEVEHQNQAIDYDQHPLQNVNIVNTELVQNTYNVMKQVVQQVSDVQLNPTHNVTMVSYQTVEYGKKTESGGQLPSERIEYNIIEVNDSSSRYENGVIDDSDIKGSGKLHSRVINDSLQQQPAPSPTEQSNQVLQNSHLSEQQHVRLDQYPKTEIISQNPNLDQLQVIKRQSSSSTNKFIRQIQQINSKLNSDKYLFTQDQKQVIIHTQHQLLSNHLSNLPNSTEINHHIAQQIVQHDPIMHYVNQIIQNQQVLPIDRNSNQSPQNSNQTITQTQFIESQPLINQLNVGLEQNQHNLQFNTENPTQVNFFTTDQAEKISLNQNGLNVSKLKVSMLKAPTQSEFGNISQIMDVNKDLKNIFNVNQQNFLAGTLDPRTQQFLKQFISITQKGNVEDQGLTKITMTNEEKNKLAKFMEKWQSVNSLQEQNIHQYMDEFRSTITRSQLNVQSSPDEEAKIRMSAQDKQTLKIIVDKLNGRFFQEDGISSDKKYPTNYDQSYVNVQCSDLKTEVALVQKADIPLLQIGKVQPEVEFLDKNQEPIDVGVVNILVQGFQKMQSNTEILEQGQEMLQETSNEGILPRRKIGQTRDFITEVIEINKILQKEDQHQKNEQIKQLNDDEQNQITEN